MFKMFRIDYEWDQYMGANMWDTHQRFRYVLGFSRLGQECYKLVNDDNRITNICALVFSLRGLWVCGCTTDSMFKNLTKR